MSNQPFWIRVFLGALSLAVIVGLTWASGARPW